MKSWQLFAASLTVLAGTATAAPRIVAAGQGLTFNFDLRAATVEPLPPYDGVTLVTGVGANTVSSDTRCTWQIYSGLDGSGTLLFTADEGLAKKDIFSRGLRYGVFSVRLTVTQGQLSVDPTASAFRNVSREIGPLFGATVEPLTVVTAP